jgi:hypothetical protein
MPGVVRMGSGLTFHDLEERLPIVVDLGLQRDGHEQGR